MATFSSNSFGGSFTPRALNTTPKSVLNLYAQTGANVLCRGKLMEMRGGPISDPGATNCNILYSVMRTTADGTGSEAVTPNPEEIWETGTPPVARTLVGANYTGEPTGSIVIWSLPANQFTSFMWYAPAEKGLPWPAVVASGLACRAAAATASYTGTSGWSVKHEE